MSFKLDMSISSTPAVVGDFERRTAVAHIDLNLLVVKLSSTQTFTKLFASALGAVAAFGLQGHEREVEKAFLSLLLGSVLNFIQALLANHVDGDFNQIANHGFNIAANVADLGELARFNFKEGRIREFRQTARDFGFSDASRAHHKDVFRHDILGHIRIELLAADAVAQSDGDGSFRVSLADDILIELANNFTRR